MKEQQKRNYCFFGFNALLNDLFFSHSLFISFKENKMLYLIEIIFAEGAIQNISNSLKLCNYYYLMVMAVKVRIKSCLCDKSLRV